MRLIALFAVSLCACAPSIPPFRAIAPAGSAADLVVSGERLAFVDGPSIRVISLTGDDQLTAPASSPHGIALGTRSVAALEDGGLRFHPFDGGAPTLAAAVDDVVAVAALDDGGFLWCEAHVETAGALATALVRSDPFGAVRKRTFATLDAVDASTVFGLAVDGNDALLGAGDRVFRIDRTTGAVVVAWQARPADRATGLALDRGAVVVAGHTAHGGFVGTIDSALPIDLVAPSRVASSGTALIGIDEKSVDVAAHASSAITGLAAEADAVWVTTAAGVFAFQ